MRWPAEWRDPATLRLLEGTAINCLVVDGSAGDLQPIIAEARKRGLVVVGPGEPSVAWLGRAGCSNLVSGQPATDAVHSKFRVHQLEKGQVAIAKADFADPYVLAADAHILLGRRNDVIRTWNASSVICHCAAAPGGGRVVVHLVSYTHRPAEFITLGVRGRWRSARFWTIGSDRPVLLEPTAAGGMAEFHLPPVSVYAALELEGA